MRDAARSTRRSEEAYFGEARRIAPVKREIQAMVGPLGPNGYVDHFQGCSGGGKWSEALSIIAAPATVVDGGTRL